VASRAAADKSRDEIAAPEPSPVCGGRWWKDDGSRPSMTILSEPSFFVTKKMPARADAQPQAYQPRVHQAAEEVEALSPRSPQDDVPVGVDGEDLAALDHVVDLALGPTDERAGMVHQPLAFGRKTLTKGRRHDAAGEDLELVGLVGPHRGGRGGVEVLGLQKIVQRSLAMPHGPRAISLDPARDARMH
jgi:hypothetical protein